MVTLDLDPRFLLLSGHRQLFVRLVTSVLLRIRKPVEPVVVPWFPACVRLPIAKKVLPKSLHGFELLSLMKTQAESAMNFPAWFENLVAMAVLGFRMPKLVSSCSRVSALVKLMARGLPLQSGCLASSAELMQNVAASALSIQQPMMPWLVAMQEVSWLLMNAPAEILVRTKQLWQGHGLGSKQLGLK
jgi:hypothetical protein